MTLVVQALFWDARVSGISKIKNQEKPVYTLLGKKTLIQDVQHSTKTQGLNS